MTLPHNNRMDDDAVNRARVMRVVGRLLATTDRSNNIRSLVLSTCFAIMPFGGYFDGYWKDIFRPALEAAGVTPVRADEIYGTGAIIEDIYSAILQSELCIADVTGKNPNVSYELGMAHTAQKPTILITQNISDVPFDYRHLRHIVYDPMRSGWQVAFSNAIQRTVREVLSNPRRHVVLKIGEDYGPAKDVVAMRVHLSNIFHVQAYELDRVNEIQIDEDGGCSIRTSWQGTARSRLHHICHNVVCDAPCQIVVKRAYDVINARDLDCVTYEESKNHKSYFALLKQHKEPGQQYHIQTEVSAPGYLDVNLFSTRDGALLSTQAVALGIYYTRKVDRLILPKESRFSRLQAEIISHPRQELVGSVVKSVESANNYVLELVYEAGQPYQQETACRLRFA